MENLEKKTYDIHSVKNRQYKEKIRQLCNDAPWYIRGFARSTTLTALSPATQYAYLFSIIKYIEYVQNIEERYTKYPFSEIPVVIFDLQPEQIDLYLSSITTADRVNHSEKSIAPLYQNRILAAFRSFYTYLHKNTLLTYEYPIMGARRQKVIRSIPEPVSEEDIDRLIEGIKRNDMYLSPHTDENGRTIKKLVPIPETYLLRRQRSIKRNIAIIRLISDAGLSVSETAGLNISCIDWVNHTIMVTDPDGTIKKISCTDKILQALRDYLHAPYIPKDLLQRQSSQMDFLDFCRKHITDPKAAEKATKKFFCNDERFLTDITICCSYLRNSGRNSYFPHPYDDALFLSNRSRRISVRMIEQMIDDMTKTYLPDLSKNRNISPAVLRLSAHDLG